MDQRLNVEGKTNLFTSDGSNFQPMPLKAKSKGSKIRKKSKYKEPKSVKEKEATPQTSKPKTYKKVNASTVSTPLN